MAKNATKPAKKEETKKPVIKSKARNNAKLTPNMTMAERMRAIKKAYRGK